MHSSYDGFVEQGKDYIIVDDVFSMGGTVNSLRNFIEDNGGNVVAISTLTAGVDNIKTIAITDETLYNLNKLDEKGEILNAITKLDIAENYELLTEAFGQYVLKNSEKLLNEERNRRTKENSISNDGRTSKNNEIEFSESIDMDNLLFYIENKKENLVVLGDEDTALEIKIFDGGYKYTIFAFSESLNKMVQ